MDCGGKTLNEHPDSISLRGIEIILEQMKKSACKIYINEVFKGTGFFCKIPLGNNNLLPVLCTSSYIINESILKTENKISISQNNKFISSKNKIYK